MELTFGLRLAVSDIRTGYDTWPLAKVPEVTHILSFYPTVEFELIFALVVSDFQNSYLADFQNCHFELETWPVEKFQTFAHALCFYPGELTLSLVSLDWQHFPRYD